ncbi:expressed protein [Phakopsora pachyrhizi]|uniref:Expressed protein n=1 Tax=Phakopsora pachyrhizi TaxID=170000 RepID=A0AAV0BFQ3_PHAPC|nr:expressed protein [Phakopsora pachyrhizi]
MAVMLLPLSNGHGRPFEIRAGFIAAICIVCIALLFLILIMGIFFYRYYKKERVEIEVPTISEESFGDHGPISFASAEYSDPKLYPSSKYHRFLAPSRSSHLFIQMPWPSSNTEKSLPKNLEPELRLQTDGEQQRYSSNLPPLVERRTTQSSLSKAVLNAFAKNRSSLSPTKESPSNESRNRDSERIGRWSKWFKNQYTSGKPSRESFSTTYQSTDDHHSLGNLNPAPMKPNFVSIRQSTRIPPSRGQMIYQGPPPALVMTSPSKRPRPGPSKLGLICTNKITE